MTKTTNIAFRIDAETLTITEVKIGDYRTIYPHIGNDCSAFDCVRIDKNGDTLYVDDEGLMKPNRLFGVKMSNGEIYPIAGNAILLGSTASGDSSQPKMTVADLKSRLIRNINPADYA